MEEQNKDFLTPTERASLNSEGDNNARIIENNLSGSGDRPTIITVLCGYFFIAWSLSIINLIGLTASLPEGATFSFNLTGFSLKGIFALVLSFSYIVSVFGYWLMKKWSVYLYAVLVILSVIITLVTLKTITFFFFSSLVLPAIMVWMGFKYLDRMS